MYANSKSEILGITLMSYNKRTRTFNFPNSKKQRKVSFKNSGVLVFGHTFHIRSIDVSTSTLCSDRQRDVPKGRILKNKQD